MGEQCVKWGTGHGGEKRGRVSGVLSAPLPLLPQEDPSTQNTSAKSLAIGVHAQEEGCLNHTPIRG
eukprot:1195126-Prorocentrum_minimum.AAC.2